MRGVTVPCHVPWLRCPRDISSFFRCNFYNSSQHRIVITHAVTVVILYTAPTLPYKSKHFADAFALQSRYYWANCFRIFVSKRLVAIIDEHKTGAREVTSRHFRCRIKTLFVISHKIFQRLQSSWSEKLYYNKNYVPTPQKCRLLWSYLQQYLYKSNKQHLLHKVLQNMYISRQFPPRECHTWTPLLFWFKLECPVFAHVRLWTIRFILRICVWHYMWFQPKQDALSPSAV